MLSDEFKISSMFKIRINTFVYIQYFHWNIVCLYLDHFTLFFFLELINPRPQSRKSSARDDERRVKQNKAAKPPPPTKRQSSKSGGKKS